MVSRFVFNLGLVLTLTLFFLPYQNCGGDFAYPLIDKTINEPLIIHEYPKNCLDDFNNPIPGCLLETPEPEITSQSCNIENGTGIQYFTGNSWSDCEIESCNSGYLHTDNQCLFHAITRSCEIANGKGTKTDEGQGFGPCTVQSCNPGYREQENSCVFIPVTRACTIANGKGIQTNTGNGFGACTLQSCNTGYRAQGNACAFIPVTRDCNIANGKGTQTNNGSGFGACTVKSCNTGYAVKNNSCVFTPVTRACNISNGKGVQTNTGKGFSACTLQSCNAGYRAQGNACVFIPVTRACAIANGKGVQTNTGKGFGACTLQSCNTGYRGQNNACVFIPVTRNCAIANGVGSQTNNGNGFSACTIKSCNSGYQREGNKCVASSKSCTILNGTGTQRYAGNGKWGVCNIAKCNAGHVPFGKMCVKSSAPTARVKILILRRDNGTGNELWTDSFVNLVIEYMTRVTRGNVKFVLYKRENIRDTKTYESLKQDSSEKYRGKREFNVITAIITNQNTTDSAGTAFNIKYNYEPFFAARARLTHGNTVYDTVDKKAKIAAEVMLHELGHNMGMKHDYSKPVTMDNHYFMTPEVLVNYIKGLNTCTSQVCQCRYLKYGYCSFNNNHNDR